MNQAPDRKRLWWLAAIGAVLVVSLLFVSMLAPSAHPGETTGDVSLNPQSAQLTGDGTATTGGPATAVDSGGGGFSLGGGEALSLAWRLALVIVIIAVSIAGLRWWGKRAAGPRSTTGFVRVIDTLAISNGRTIHLVALGDRVIAVGATPQQLTLLNELSDEEAADVLARMPQQSEQPLSLFAAELFQSMRGTQAPRSRRREITIGEELQ